MRSFPAYDRGEILRLRAPRAKDFVTQIVDTIRPYLHIDMTSAIALDVGCAYGYTSVELAKRCRQVVGIEPCPELFDYAESLRRANSDGSLHFRNQGIEELEDVEQYDLVILDNVLEHIPNQELAVRKIVQSLRPGGVLFLIVPNKLWPLEVHYRLWFLSYLPIRFANWYLRLTRRGLDYADASYAPTFGRLNRLLRKFPELTCNFVTPANVELATYGKSLHYRLGVAALRYFPWLWRFSKVFLVVAVKA